jgi:hypothetical protein
MRTLILTTTAIFGIAIAAPALAQQATEEADRGIKTRNSGESGFVGQQESPGASAHPPGRPDQGSGQTTTGTAGSQGSETSRSPR